MTSRTNPLTALKIHAAAPYLVVKNAADAIEFYERAFGAKKIGCLTVHGKVGEAQLRIGGVRFKLSDEYPESGLLSPQSAGGAPAVVVVNVQNVDRFVGKAIAIGARLRDPVDGRLLGRAGSLEDPFGHIWRVTAARKAAGKATVHRLRAGG